MDERKEGETVTVTGDGQVTIPEEIRNELGIDTPGRIRFIPNEDGGIEIRRVKRPSEMQGELTSEISEKEQTATEMLREERERDK